MSYCSLCQENHAISFLFQSKAMKVMREFWHCQNCDLVFVPKEFHVDPKIERSQYELHENHGENAGYLALLEPVRRLVIGLCQDGDVLLDYGSGPHPFLVETLKKDLSSKNVLIQSYDPFFSPKEPSGKISLMTCTEVVEHFCDVKEQWQKLLGFLDQSGTLLVLTQMTDRRDLPSWHYIRDITHVTFYSVKTFECIAKFYNLSFRMQEGVAVFSKL